MHIFTWLKTQKVSTFLIVVVLVLFATNYRQYRPQPSFSGESQGVSRSMIAYDSPAMSSSEGLTAPSVVAPAAPPTDTSDRLVVRDTTLSLVVNQVPDTISAIESIATEAGGYMVDSHLSRPEWGGSGTITIRVPEINRLDTLTRIKALAVKTVSEQVLGHDVTDRYVDNAAKLATLLQTKAKFETIFNDATRIQDILEIQRELINLQSQIDNLKGSQQLLEQTAKFVKMTFHLSTDEYELPYAPVESWRPEVIFKQAVRSLIQNVRTLATWMIWLAVYAPVWFLLLLVVWWYRRRLLKKV